MEPPVTGHDAISRDESPVHKWRVSQLKCLGLPGPFAEIYATWRRCGTSLITGSGRCGGLGAISPIRR